MFSVAQPTREICTAVEQFHPLNGGVYFAINLSGHLGCWTLEVAGPVYGEQVSCRKVRMMREICPSVPSRKVWVI